MKLLDAHSCVDRCLTPHLLTISNDTVWKYMTWVPGRSVSLWRMCIEIYNERRRR